MSDQQEHIGLISAVDGSKVSVRLVDDPTCHSCSMASFCNMDEDRSLLELDSQVPGWKVGEEVMVKLRNSAGLTATLLAYVLPFLLVVATLLLILKLGYGEMIAASVSLLVLVPYYIVVHLLKGRLRHYVKLQIFRR